MTFLFHGSEGIRLAKLPCTACATLLSSNRFTGQDTHIHSLGLNTVTSWFKNLVITISLASQPITSECVVWLYDEYI